MTEVQTDSEVQEQPQDLANMSPQELIKTEEAARAAEAKAHGEKVRAKALKTIEDLDKGHSSYDYAKSQIDAADTADREAEALKTEIAQLEKYIQENGEATTETFKKALEAKKLLLRQKKAKLANMDTAPTFKTFQKIELEEDPEYQKAFDLIAQKEQEVHEQLLEKNRKYSDAHRYLENATHMDAYAKGEKLTMKRLLREELEKDSEYNRAKAYIDSKEKSLLAQARDEVNSDSVKYGFTKLDQIPDGEDGISAGELRTEMGAIKEKEAAEIKAAEEAELKKTKQIKRLQEALDKGNDADQNFIAGLRRMIETDKDEEESPESLEYLKRMKTALEDKLQEDGVKETYDAAKPHMARFVEFLRKYENDPKDKEYCKRVLEILDRKGDYERASRELTVRPISTKLDDMKKEKEKLEQADAILDLEEKALKKNRGGAWTKEGKWKKAGAVLNSIDVLEKVGINWEDYCDINRYGNLASELRDTNTRKKMVDGLLRGIEDHRQKAPARLAELNKVLQGEGQLRNLQELTKTTYRRGGLYDNGSYTESPNRRRIRFLEFLEGQIAKKSAQPTAGTESTA